MKEWQGCDRCALVVLSHLQQMALCAAKPLSNQQLMDIFGLKLKPNPSPTRMGFEWCAEAEARPPNVTQRCLRAAWDKARIWQHSHGPLLPVTHVILC